jgi:hypothetical protein
MILSLINEAAAVIYFHNELAVLHIDWTLFTFQTGRGRDYFYEELQYKVMFSRLLYTYMGGIKQKSQVSLIRKVWHCKPSQIVYIYAFFSLGWRRREKSQGAQKSIKVQSLNFYFICFQFMFSTLIMEFIFII